MKPIFFIIPFLLFLKSLNSQTNIVVNGSFEEAVDPDCSWGDNGFCPEGVFYSKVVEYFENFPGWVEPKKKFPCSQFLPGVGTSDILCSSNHYLSRTGSRLGHASAGEFLIGELSEETQKNIYYYTEFYAFTWYIDYFDLGIRFFKEQPKQCGGGMLSSPLQSSGASDVFAPLLVLPLEKYTKVSKYVIHSEKYKYIGLGQHNGFASNTILYDDVRILKLNENACPPYWKFQNTEFNTDMLFQASDYITIGENHDNMIVI